VAEWQTRQTQNLLSERTWEFKSPRPHQSNQRLRIGSRAACKRRRRFVPSLSLIVCQNGGRRSRFGVFSPSFEAREPVQAHGD
jgi:hypothetical protein